MDVVETVLAVGFRRVSEESTLDAASEPGLTR